MSTTYLTRAEVAERYPISVHTLAKLASDGTGPRFYKPTDKCLYRAEDIESWIEAAVVEPRPPNSSVMSPAKRTTAPRPATRSGRGKAIPDPKPNANQPLPRRGRKSLPPSPNSWLLRNKD